MEGNQRLNHEYIHKNESNFLIKQYKKDNNYKIKHSYLKEQFSDTSKIFTKIKNFYDGDYTLGSVVELKTKLKNTKIKWQVLEVAQMLFF